MTPKISSLHTRLRQFADHLIEEEMRVYHELGINIPHRWHAILQIFNDEDRPYTITELADIQNKTHPDVVYTVNQMLRHGLVKEMSDRNDKRKRFIKASEKAHQLIIELKPAWQATQDATNFWVKEVAPDLWLNIEALNNSLEKKSFFQRIKKEKKRADLRNVQLIRFEDVQNGQILIQNFWNQFKNKYFNIDEMDNYMLNVEEHLLKNQGVVYFSRWGESIIGCICLIRRSFRFGEVVHLWVDEGFRRRYVGTSLMNKTIAAGKEMGVNALFAQSHPKLVAANAILQHAGFTTSDHFPKAAEEFSNMPMILVKDIL
ncbi:MAG: bifunctional helix-turn-helix transcriptional regulator/GNAT family N-acetyltransferase [Saprospiraceae bacterium]|nr:bifunctional helix-turn-helix transcriptional regulator/GNAT family N-acetyltransferase [Saprospiraceae bacterium]